MAAKKKAKKKAARRGGAAELIISKARTKAATRKCNVGGEFYGALDKVVRKMIPHIVRILRECLGLIVPN